MQLRLDSTSTTLATPEWDKILFFLLCLMMSHDPVNFLINRMGVPKKFRPKKFLKKSHFVQNAIFFQEAHKFWILNLTLSLREGFEKKQSYLSHVMSNKNSSVLL